MPLRSPSASSPFCWKPSIEERKLHTDQQLVTYASAMSSERLANNEYSNTQPFWSSARKVIIQVLLCQRKIQCLKLIHLPSTEHDYIIRTYTYHTLKYTYSTSDDCHQLFLTGDPLNSIYCNISCWVENGIFHSVAVRPSVLVFSIDDIHLKMVWLPLLASLNRPFGRCVCVWIVSIYFLPDVLSDSLDYKKLWPTNHHEAWHCVAPPLAQTMPRGHSPSVRSDEGNVCPRHDLQLRVRTTNPSNSQTMGVATTFHSVLHSLLVWWYGLDSARIRKQSSYYNSCVTAWHSM